LALSKDGWQTLTAATFESITSFIGSEFTLSHHGLLGWAARVLQYSDYKSKRNVCISLFMKTKTEFSMDRFLKFEIVKEELRVIKCNHDLVKV